MNPPEVPASPPPVPAQPQVVYLHAPEPQNALAVVSAVCGGLSLLGICCCLAGLLALPAIICGHLGLSRSRDLGGKGREASIAGLIMGYIALLLMIASLGFSALSLGNSGVMDEIKKQFENEMRKAQEQQR
jgi:hypothetical protein